MPALSQRPWEAAFIRLWQADASQAAVAAPLHISASTVKPHTHLLQQEGKIQLRPPWQGLVDRGRS
jgi:ATP/maltotriose-dependent transcriptional regulator MalT